MVIFNIQYKNNIIYYLHEYDSRYYLLFRKYDQNIIYYYYILLVYIIKDIIEY